MDNPEPADDDLALNMDYSYLLNFQLDPPEDKLTEHKFYFI